MLIRIFHDFQNALKDNYLTMMNENFNYILETFSFEFYTNENQKILDHKNKYPIIIIDEHIENQINYYNICFDNNFFIVMQKDLHQFSNFFVKNKDSKVYLIFEKTNDFISNYFESINFSNNIENQTEFFKEEIQSFQRNCILKKNRNGIDEILIFWLKKVYRSISGLLIQKAHYKNIFNRNSIITNFCANKNFKEIEIKSDEYIEMLTLHGGSSSIIKLIYYIKTEDIFSMKELFDPINKVKLFDREHENYLKLRHPYFAQFFGTVQIKDHKALLIEYINGKSLNHIKEMKLNEEYKLKIIFEIIMIVKFVHDNGYVLRDLTPSNIMIDKNNSVILIDFDRMIRVENINDEERTKDFLNDYIAQEIITNESFSFEADIFSLGLLIYFIFSEQNVKVELDKKLKLNYYCFDEKLKDLKKICDQCIKIDASKRIKMDEIIHLFFKYFNKINKIYLNDISKYMYLLSVASDLNDVIARLFLFQIYYDINFDKSFYYINLAANQNNNPEAQLWLGMLFLEGKYIPKDIDKAIYYFKLSSNKIKSVNTILAAIFSSNKFNRKSNESFHYLQKASQSNERVSTIELGKIYYRKGYIEESIKFFMKAHEQNDQEAQLYLGYIYSNPNYSFNDMNKAVYFYTLSANKDNAYSQLNLGIIYLGNHGIKADIKKSIHYLTLAASRKFILANRLLGLIYYSIRDIKKSIYFFIIATKQNDGPSAFNLGLIYYKGKQVQIDINKAIYYFKLADEQKYNDCLFYLAIIYSENKYIPIDFEKAFHYYNEASCFNDNYAKNNLGVWYKQGIYIKKNLQYAIELFEEGIRYKNDFVCMLNLASIYFFDPEIHDYDKAIDLLVNQCIYNSDYPLIIISLCLIKKLKNCLLTIKEIEIEIKKRDRIRGKFTFSTFSLHKVHFFRKKKKKCIFWKKK